MTFGSGVRAQVFEVIVRQAIAGAPWQIICAGPMRINNISPEEVEFEVDRRLNAGKEYLPAEKQVELTEYLSLWEQNITNGKMAPQAQINDLVADLYELSELKRPMVVFCESPAKLLFYLTHLSTNPKSVDLSVAKDQNESFKRHLQDSMKELPSSRLGNPVSAALRSRYMNELMPNVIDQMGRCLDSKLCSYFKYGIRHQVDRFLQRFGTTTGVALNSVAPQSVGEALAAAPMLGSLVGGILSAFAPLGTPIAADLFRPNIWGIWQFPDLLSYGFIQEHLGDDRLFSPPADKLLSTWVGLFKAAPYYSFFENYCFVGCYAQSTVYDQQFRLSNRTGAAITFADGYQIFAVDGIVASRQLIENPETITVSDINQTGNVALRRLLIESYGTARFLKDSGAELVQKDECGELYRKELPGDEPLFMVCVTNSTPEADGSYKQYFLRVPPNSRTAKEAVAWTFGMISPEYHPKKET